jgi:hypothetical protein
MLSGCSAPAPTPRSVYDRFAKVYPLEAGVLYDSEASKTSVEYLDHRLLWSLLRRADGSYDAEDIASVVVYLGAAGEEHRELLIFQCHNKDAAREVAALCAARAEPLRETVGADARVLCSGKTVLLFALSDNLMAQRLLLRFLH